MASPTIIASVLTGGVSNHPTSSEEVNGVATDFVSEGVVGTFTNTSGVAPATGAFACNASGTPDANINISVGVAYVTATPTSQNSQTIRINCSVTGTLAISANASGSTKYDWIYISVSATNAANPNTAGDNVATVVASRSSSASTDDGTPPTYGYPIAVVTVANGFTTITNANIRDVRSNSTVNLGSSSVSSGWLDLGYTPSTVTALGNRSYSMVYDNVNLTTSLSNGMRLKTTRLVTAPTQCTDLEASSSQYYNKTSPAGMTFTDDFVVSAWVKLESYTQGAIISRYNGTSGWTLRIESDGTVRLLGYNAASANFSSVTSYQSVPLNRWVHIAAQLDMSAFTATTTTSYVMLDGVNVPAFVARGGTNPTALVQAGNLEVGATNSGTLPFDGKLAQVAVYSAKVTQATILASIHQTLSGSETSLISAYSFNNTINDLNVSNANNLTAQGSAVATNADSPFGLQADGATAGTTDYAIITKTAFSTDTTLTVQVPEGNTIPTSGGVSAVAYSTQKVPYGLPIQQGRWAVLTKIRVQASTTNSATYVAYNSNGDALTVPIGEWNFGTDMVAFNGGTTSGEFALCTTSPIGSAAGSQDENFTFRVISAAAVTIFIPHSRRVPISVTSASTYTLYWAGATSTGGIDSDNELHQIIAEFDLL